jgi:membrane associated rhomboid family serine protease
MILPIGHENSSVRRIPWVTSVIIVICILVHIVISNKMDKLKKEFIDYGQQFFEYYITHPYLELDPEIEKFFVRSEAQQEGLSQLLERYNEEEPSDYQIEEEQEELDRLGGKVLALIKAIPHMKWGYIPAKKSVKTLFTSMFLHADWWHLIFNLLFLFLSAPFIEDVWGKPIFAVFYILMGMFSALAHSMHFPNSIVPLVGASGAIAGVMGAFLVRYFNTRIRFAFFFTIFIRGTFKAPAWLMLPLWLVSEFMSARFMDTTNALSGEGGGGVAHWVHVWGFVFGVIVALAIKFFNIEKKYVTPKIDAQTSFVNENFTVYEQAMDVYREGDKEESYSMLLDSVRKDATFTDNVEALWNIGLEIDKKAEAAPYLQRAMESAIRQNNMEPALIYYKQLDTHIGNVYLSTVSKILLMEQMIKQHEYEDTQAFIKEITPEINTSTPPGVLISFCNALSLLDLETNSSNAHTYIKIAMNHPDIPDSTKANLKERLFQKPSGSHGDTISIGGGVGLAAAGMAAFQPPRQEQQPQQPTTPPPIPVTHSKPKKSALQEEHKVPQSPSEPPMGTSGSVFNVEDFGLNESEPPKPPPIPDFAKINADHQSSSPAQTPQSFPTPQESKPPLPDTPPPIPTAPMDPVSADIDKAMVFETQKKLKPTIAQPLGLKEGRLAMVVDGVGQRALPLTKLKAIAVVKITPLDSGAFLLIDLFLDDPKNTASAAAKATIIEIRSLRITSAKFNPQTLIPNTKTVAEAFRKFTSGLIRLSGAKPYPNLDAVKLQKVITFNSIEEYEEMIIN